MTRLVAVLTLIVTSFSYAQEESWMKVEIGGQPVGYEFSTQSTSGDRIETESTTLIRMNRFGQTFEMRTVLNVIEENEKLRSFRLEQHTPGQPVQVSRGRVDGDVVKVTSTSNGRESTQDIKLPSGLLSPTAADRIIDEDPPADGESRTLNVFSIETLAPTQITLTGLGKKTTAWSDGSKKSIAAIQLTRSDMPLSPTFYIDENGEAAKVDFGLMQMIGWATTREDALAAAEGKNDIDLGERTVLKISPQPGLSSQETATYRVTGASLESTPGSQAVVPDGDGVLVTVTTPSLDQFKSAGDVDKKYLASTRWVDWQNEGIQKLAARLDDSAGVASLARDAEKLVSKAVSKKSFGVGFATASEVAATKEGDCTEHGVLLAAVLRASGLPSRVCFGLVYVESMAALVPHMWTEVALDDVWVPLDATRPGRPNGGYLKFGDSALDSDAALPIKDLLQLSQELESMRVVIADKAAVSN